MTLKSDNPFEEAIINFKGYDDTELTKIANPVTELSPVMSSPTFTFVKEQLRPESSVDLGDADAVND